MVAISWISGVAGLGSVKPPGTILSDSIFSGQEAGAEVGMEQVRTAAKGSVDVVNTGPSFSKTKSKEGAPAPAPAGGQASARTCGSPLPTSPPRRAAPGAPTTEQAPSTGVTGQGGARRQEVELSTGVRSHHQPDGRKEARPPAQAGGWVLEEGPGLHH